MTKRWIIIVCAVVALAAIAALMLTLFNKAWWIRRAAARWGYQREEIDGAVWLTMGTSPFMSYRETYLLDQPLRRLKELYDTGVMKEPGATGGNIEVDLP